MAAEDLKDEIADAASKPKKATVDGNSVEAQSLADLKEADKYLASKDAVKGRKRGFNKSVFKPPGTV